MNENDNANDQINSRSIKTIWRCFKRALVTQPDIQNEPNHYNDNNRSNSNNGGELATLPSDIPNINEASTLSNSSHDKSEYTTVKRQRLNIATKEIDSQEEISFMEIMKNLLSCSICLEVSSYSNQCPNGHLICITCSGRLQQTPGELNCPVCRVSLKQGLHRSLLAEQLTSELPAACRFCSKILPVKNVKRHESTECSKRKVPCKYKLFGCTWIGIEESLKDHVNECSIAEKTVGSIHDKVQENINQDMQLLQVPLSIWKSIVARIRSQTVGSRVILRQTTLNKSLGEEAGDLVFKSPIIRVPFSCCSMHGFYVDLFVKKDSTDSRNVEKLSYCLRSENKTKITLNYFICAVKIDETQNLEVQDVLHLHHFESAHKETLNHELKLLSIDCDKPQPIISRLDNIFIEICLISERERSERSHGILNANDDDEHNPFVGTSNSDSNVVFTLFSPSTSSSRSMNTSNAMLNSQEDGTIINDMEPSHDEDIVITVTDNVESGDDGTEHRDNNNIHRNNHSYVAVPTVFINPNPQMFTYSPYPFDNSMLTSFQQSPRVTRELMTTSTVSTDNSQNEIRINQENDNSTTNQRLPNNPQRSSDILTQSDPNRILREQMSMFYPPQTIVSPYLSNAVSPLALRTSVPRNIIIHPRPNNSQVDNQQHSYFNNQPIQALNHPNTQNLMTQYNAESNSNQTRNGGDVSSNNNDQNMSYSNEQSDNPNHSDHYND